MEKQNGNTSIGSSIRKIRKARKYSQKEFSEILDCSTTQISNIERGLAIPTFKRVMSFSNKFYIPLSESLGKCKEENESVRQDIKVLSMETDRNRVLTVLKTLEYYKELLHQYNNATTLSDEEYESGYIDYTSAARYIKKIRESKNIPVNVMAKKLGINVNSYRNIESDNGCASIGKYIEIAEELNVPIDFLFQDSVKNKEAVIEYYTEKVYDNAPYKEDAMIKEITEAIMFIMKKYDM